MYVYAIASTNEPKVLPKCPESKIEDEGVLGCEAARS